MPEWEFFENAEPQGSSDGFWYDLTAGGYIDLAKLIYDPEQLKHATSAIEVLKSLQDALEGARLLNEF